MLANKKKVILVIPVLAETGIKVWALISFTNAFTWSSETGANCPVLGSGVLESLKSALVPTRMVGTSGT